jgi:ankyrin repeat protein
MELFEICERDPEQLKRLLDEGANVNARTIYGSTLLHYASWGQPSLVEYLIHKGVDVNSRNMYGYTPLHYAEQRQTIEILLKHGANIHDTSNDAKQSPLECACIDGNTEAIRVLYEHGGRIGYIPWVELNKVIALFAGMCWKRSRVGGLPSHILISYMV